MSEIRDLWNASDVKTRERMLEEVGVKNVSVRKKWARCSWDELFRTVRFELVRHYAEDK